MHQPLDIETVGTRLVQAAGIAGHIAGIAQFGDACWAIDVEDAHPCLAQLEPGGLHLTVSTDVGTPPQGRHDAVRGAALSYNALWRETGGARIVQAGGGGELTLLRQFGADEVHAPEFPAAVDHFITVGLWWNAYVTDENGEVPQPSNRMNFTALRQLVAHAKDDALLKGKVEKGQNGEIKQLFLKTGGSSFSLTGLVARLSGRREQQTAQARELLREVVREATSHPSLKNSKAIQSLEALLAGSKDIRAGDVRAAFSDLDTAAQVAGGLSARTSVKAGLQDTANALLRRPPGPGGARPETLIARAPLLFNSLTSGAAAVDDALGKDLSPPFRSALATIAQHNARLMAIEKSENTDKQFRRQPDAPAPDAADRANLSVAAAARKALGHSLLLAADKLDGASSVQQGLMQLMTRANMLLEGVEKEALRKPAGDAAKVQAFCKEFVDIFPRQLTALKAIATLLDNPKAFAQLPRGDRAMFGEIAQALGGLYTAITDPASPYTGFYQFAQAAQADPKAALAAAEAALR